MRTRTIGASWAMAAAVVIGVGSASTARAEELVVVKVPFDFIVGDTRMPAGRYVINQMTDDPNMLSVKNEDGHNVALTLTIPAYDRDAKRAELKFARFDNEYFLSKVVTPGEDAHQVILTPAKMEHELEEVSVNP